VKRHTLTAVLFSWCLLSSAARPQEPQRSASPTFDRRVEMIVMRDGSKLNTVIHAPKDQKVPLPIILQRSPYGVNFQTPLNSYLRDLANDGYIFVFQDIRGRFQSEGEFAMVRAPRDKSNPKAFDESSDTYDTIEWLVKNVPNNNGKVGMLGISYDGWLTTMALIDPHPALQAASPQAPVADMFLGDDFHHNGAFRLSYGYEYVAMMETNKTNSSPRFDRADMYEWYLKLGPLSNVNKNYFHGKMPTWNDFVKHPNYDEFWQKQAAAKYLTKVTVPTMSVAGWWDQEDFYGPLKTYATLEPHDQQGKNFIVIGPWNHGGWAGGDGSNLGKIRFDQPTAKYYREKVQTGFFGKFLKDRNSFDVTDALTFQTGSNKWTKTDAWPPKASTTKPLYFRADGKLSFSAPESSAGDAQAFDSYVSDPAKPVPYRARPIQPTYGPGSVWSTWLVQDQRFVHNRPDVASWETDPLTDDVVLAGNVMAKLFASTSGTDSDWIVKLIDVYPDTAEAGMAGYQLMVANDVLRGRFRNSFEKPEAMEPNRVYDYRIDLHQLNHCFKKGHKIMVQVQSTWFPIIDRNPQKFVPNIFEATAADYQTAQQHIYRSAQQPSHLEVPVWEETK
jgi:putative CocE/NonD family hydrolase